MAFSRPATLAESYGLSLKQVTAAGSILSAPALVYQLIVQLLDQAVTGVAKLNDGTATGFAESAAGSLTIKLGTAGASAGSTAPFVLNAKPPLKLSTGLFASATGVSIAVLYEDQII